MEESRKWEEMDANCLSVIFGKLGLEDLLLAVPFVCKPWHQASLNPTCWTKLNFLRLDIWPWGGRFCDRFLMAYETGSCFHFSGLLRLTVSRGKASVLGIYLPTQCDITVEDLDYVSNECPNLQCLSYSCLDRQLQAYLPRIVSRWTDLRCLSVRGNTYNFAETLAEVARHCLNFSTIVFYDKFVSEDEADAVVAALPELKYVCCFNCSLFKETLLVILKGCKSLAGIRIKKCSNFCLDDEIRNLTATIKTFEFEAYEEVDTDDYYSGLSMGDVYDGNSDDGYEL